MDEESIRPAPSELSEMVAEEVRAELGRRRITGAALARAIGEPQASLQRRLSGRYPFDVELLGRIADHLGVPVVQFFGGDAGLLHAPAQSRAGIPLRMAAAKLKTSQYGTWTTRVVPFGRAA